MKIQCDVCSKEAAVVFCAADEAALCHGCDRQVHHANKLASRHPRLFLLDPPINCSGQSQFAQLCDICQERRAVLFCQEDRAVLCQDCDVPLHTANEHAQKHSRFLLTRVMLSSSAPLDRPIFTDHPKQAEMIPKAGPVSDMICSPLSSEMDDVNYDLLSEEGGKGPGGGGVRGSNLDSGGLLSEILPMELMHGAMPYCRLG